jgi:hypothetical protein
VPATDGALKQELRYQLEIFALSGFAIAQPLLDVFGRSLEAFVFRGAGRLEIVLFALAVTLVPWLVLGIVAAATRLAGSTIRRRVQVVALGGLAGLIGLHVVKQTTSIRGWALALTAGAIGVGFGFVYDRFRNVGLWTRYAGVAPVLFLTLFLVASPTSSLVFPTDARAANVESSKLPRHIVFLQFDELPTESLIGQDGGIDPVRFPNFARFANDATWYRNYTTVNGQTEFATPALLSGSYPKNELATAANYPHNLFTLLGGGYEVHAGEVITALCPQSVCQRRSKGVPALDKLASDAVDLWQQQISLEDSDRQIAAGFVEETRSTETKTKLDDKSFDAFSVLSRNATSSPARLNDFIKQIGPEDRPTLEFLHLLLPHQPWHFYPSGLQYPYPPRDPGQPHLFLSGRWGREARPAEFGRQRHLLQVQYVDSLLGRVVANLRRRGLYDDSLIVVTADHGAAFTPGEEVRPGLESGDFPARTYEQIMWVPLMIKAPLQRQGDVSDANMQSVDLLPTIADMIGVRVPWKLDGTPISAPRRREKKTFFTSSVVAFKTTTLGASSTVDARTGFQRMLAGNAREFAPNPDPQWAFYRVGPYADIIGRRVDQLPSGPAAPLDVKVDDPGAFASVDPGTGSVPGLLLGSVISESDAVIAVSVNGILAGVSSQFADNAGPRRFGVLIPDFLFVKGANDVRLFSVENNGHALRPIAGL